MSVINDISIYQVKAGKNENGSHEYCVEVCWSAALSPGTHTEEWQVGIKESVENKCIITENVPANVRMHQFSGVKMDDDKSYIVFVTGTKQQKITAEEWVMTKTYQNIAGSYDREKLRLTWDEPSSDIGAGKCSIHLTKDGKDAGGIFEYEIPPYVKGMEIPFPEKFFCQKEPFKVILTPYFNKASSGPQAVIQELYAPDYRMDENGKLCCHCMEAGTEAFQRQLYAFPVYKEESGKENVPQEPITAGPLSLTNVKPYTLTLQKDTTLEREQYDAFIKECYQYVTPQAMYEILDFISRAATQKVEDMLYYCCGLSETAKRADIRPGYALRVEQAVYQYQQQMDGGNISGYIGSDTSVYKVSWHMGKEMGYLEFDSFLSRMDENLYSSESKVEQRQIGTGALELCSVNMRQPYYRIQYPEGMYTSDAEPDIYTNTRVLLLAAPGWDEVQIPFKEDDNTATPYLFFRGRSAVTLLFTISVNGKEEMVPAGTTLWKLLQQKGIYYVDEDVVRLLRRNPYGKKAGIVMDETNMNKLLELPLMHGDEIVL